MAALAYLLLIALAGISQAYMVERSLSKPVIEPCPGYEDKKLITIDELKLTPYPPVLPGTLGVKVTGSMNKDLPKLYIRAKIAKIFFNGLKRVEVPCIQGYGSCLYDICEITKDVTQCPADMDKYGIPCKCPFNKFKVGTFSETYTVKSIPSLIDWLKNGDYEVKAEILESAEGAPVACYDIKASLRSEAVDCSNPLKKFSAECKGSDPIGF